MKNLNMFVMIAFMAIMASCGSNVDKKEDIKNSDCKYDNAKAGELVNKYKDNPAKITEDDAIEVADLLVLFYEDIAYTLNDLKGERDEFKVYEEEKKFMESHKNAYDLEDIYYAIKDKVPSDRKDAVSRAKELSKKVENSYGGNISYDNKRVREMMEDDAKAVAELVVNYYEDCASYINDNKGEKDAKKLEEASKKFDEAHKRVAELVDIYSGIEDKVPADSKKAADEAKKKMDEAQKAAAEAK